MSRYHDRGVAPILGAAASWAQRCLVNDGSVFGDERLWTSENLDQLDTYFVRNLDESEGKFYEKLDGQLAPALPSAKKLMAELLWVLFLFPSNQRAPSKRDGIRRTWAMSTDVLDAAHAMLADDVLAGIGSGGMAFNSLRWKELNFAIDIFRAFKALAGTDRVALAGDYGRFADWLASQSRDGDRQFRHMLRYLLFPDQVERMSSNNERRQVLEAFDRTSPSEMSGWTDRRIDEAMLALRRRLEHEHGSPELDFYLPPLLGLWRTEEHSASPPPPPSPALTRAVREPEPSRPFSRAAPPLNQILFGPPGTGKTFHAIDKALEILEPEFLRSHVNDRAALKGRFDTLASEGLVQFVTFHQSFSYEDFVEGLRAESDAENGALRYEVADGVFKRLCDAARLRTVKAGEGPIDFSGRRIWKLSLGDSTTQRWVFEECIQNGYALLGYGAGADFSACKSRQDIVKVFEQAGEPHASADYPVTAVRSFMHHMKRGDLLVVTEGNLKFRAIGEITGDYRFIARDSGDTYVQCRDVKWLRVYAQARPYEDLMVNRFSQMTLYELREGSIDLAKLRSLLKPQDEVSDLTLPRVLIIDEINRGNVSRIFGELITLIEPSKRAGAAEALTVTLPYSKSSFSVPMNVHLIGTMNTADRSLAGLDVALRRRFQFVEMPPRPDRLQGRTIAGVGLGQLLTTMNHRIEALLDRDHQLGHAYFMDLASGDSIAGLAAVFRQQILPLLQEYFFEDWERIRWVLNDHRKPEGCRFVVEQGLSGVALFGDGVTVDAKAKLWRLDYDAFDNVESYRGIITTLTA